MVVKFHKRFIVKRKPIVTNKKMSISFMSFKLPVECRVDKCWSITLLKSSWAFLSELEKKHKLETKYLKKMFSYPRKDACCIC